MSDKKKQHIVKEPIAAEVQITELRGRMASMETALTHAVTKPEMEKALEPLRNDIAVLQKDVAQLQKDVVQLKEDVVQLKEDVAELKREVAVIKERLNHMVTKAELHEAVTTLSAEFNAKMDALERNIRGYISSMLRSLFIGASVAMGCIVAAVALIDKLL